MGLGKYELSGSECLVCQHKDLTLNPPILKAEHFIAVCAFNLILEISKRQAFSGSPLASQPNPNVDLGVQGKIASSP